MGFVYGEVVLITGGSSGIGRSAAEILSKKGYKVYGTSRRVEEGQERIISEYSNGGFFKLVNLDVKDDISVKNTVKHIIDKEGYIGILVNNAGYGIAGAAEDTSVTEAKELFETNFFGVIRMCREVLPIMRRKGKGIVINISSIAAPVTIPFQSMYSASKSALESVSEAIRMEAAPYGVKVAVIQPGDTKTGFGDNRQFVHGAKENSVYSKRLKASVHKMEADEKGGCPPEIVGNTISKVISKRNPPVKVAAGFQYKLIVLLKRFVPNRIYIYMVSRLYG